MKNFVITDLHDHYHVIGIIHPGKILRQIATMIAEPTLAKQL